MVARGRLGAVKIENTILSGARKEYSGRVSRSQKIFVSRCDHFARVKGSLVPSARLQTRLLSLTSVTRVVYPRNKLN